MEKISQEMDPWVVQTAERSPDAERAVTPPQLAYEPCCLVLAAMVQQPVQLETNALCS